MKLTLIAFFTLAVAQLAGAQVAETERAYYRLETLPIPAGISLEVGGMHMLPDGRLAVATRRGEVWIVENPAQLEGRPPRFRRFAHGLHEPLGLAYRDGSILVHQRGELTRLRDRRGDGRADQYQTVFSRQVEGNYHEYAYGPLIREDGTMIVTLNLAWLGRGASLSPWSGWMLEIMPDGEMRPFAAGMRSPAGIGSTPDGDIFYSENQGDWVGSGFITHVERGDFVGNPAGLKWTDEPGVPERLRGVKPESVPDTGEPMYRALEHVPTLKLPAVWFPHALMGISTSDILVDTTAGGFGPFAGQMFVGDQGHSKIMRVFLEKVDGTYQGAVFPFREGFQSGVLRMVWGHDGSMYVGQTSRGWSATGRDAYGLQRLVWTGSVPFEIKTVEARPDGFELTFTAPVDRVSAADPASYQLNSFLYRYRLAYGSPPIEQEALSIRGISVSDDGLSARLAVDGLRQYYIHEVRASGVRSTQGEPLLHDVAYYTLNRIPAGDRLTLSSGHTPHAMTATVGASLADAPAHLPKRLTEMPASWAGRADVTMTIGTQPGLRFSVESFEVQAGSRVQLVFDNDDDMLHNLVVVRPGTADEVAMQAIQLGLAGHDMAYVPDSDEVLFHTGLLEPETSESIFFTAPATPGDYVYVCTFPGHGTVMRGIMRVVAP